MVSQKSMHNWTVHLNPSISVKVNILFAHVNKNKIYISISHPHVLISNNKLNMSIEQIVILQCQECFETKT